MSSPWVYCETRRATTSSTALMSSTNAKKQKVMKSAGPETQLTTYSLPFARSYQLEALRKAIKQNTIVYLETGSGKTLIAVMLLCKYAYLLRKPSPFIAVFLVPQVVLVSQQAQVLRTHTDLKVGMYWGDMGVDYWDASVWKQEIDKHEVLVMTPAILLSGLRHSFFNIEMIKVLIFDECHHARGRHPYACIMKEFYHHKLHFGNTELPRIFGMTASPIKSKDLTFCKSIQQLETIMNSKVYTTATESELADFIPFSTPKFIFYKQMQSSYTIYASLVEQLEVLKEKHDSLLRKKDFKVSLIESASKTITSIFSTLVFCLNELGVWLALKAAEFFSLTESETEIFSWGKLDCLEHSIVKDFSLDASKALSRRVPSGHGWSIVENIQATGDATLLTSKVACLIQSLLGYRDLEDIRCIIFVERVITAIVLQSLLSELLPQHNTWKTAYIAGNNSALHSQTRKSQNEIVEKFREGLVNIIVATSILEEGLDVQSCNLVIRFDPSATVCSFIQSRGRARMHNSDYLLMVNSEDLATRLRLEKYLTSMEIMRKESLRHAHLPCELLQSDFDDENYYCVESTKAIVTLCSSVSLIYFYCSRLPSDCYFKPTPRFDINEEMGMCTLYLPKSCPVEAVRVQGNLKLLKQAACMEACKELHRVGALTDNLVPDIVVEECTTHDLGDQPFDNEQPMYFPSEFVGHSSSHLDVAYYCYLVELKQHFVCDIVAHDVVLLMRSELQSDIISMGFDLEADGGDISVNFKYVGKITLTPKQVMVCRMFQITIFRVLLNHNIGKSKNDLHGVHLESNSKIDYLLLPSISSPLETKIVINWDIVFSVLFPYKDNRTNHFNLSTSDHSHLVQTKDGMVCTCLLQNSIVCTPHNDRLYCIAGVFNDLNANSILRLQKGGACTYKEYYALRHGVELCFEQEALLRGRPIFTVKNFLHCRVQKKEKESNGYVELPPEICSIVMSPIPIGTLFSFSFVPSIMHRLESLLIAGNLRKMNFDQCVQSIDIPVNKVLEAITTKKCQENFDLESLETLGDSFLKYAVSQHLFRAYLNNHEGLLSVKRERIISNAALAKIGCERKISGFIRDGVFDPRKWIVPGYASEHYSLNEELLFDGSRVFIVGRRNLKRKRIADVVEALIGAYLSSCGEMAAILFLKWLGIYVEIDRIPHKRRFQMQAEELINVKYLESLLRYSFRDPSLLVEALTHASYTLPEIPTCYQRLEFLGDSVLDYLITQYLYTKYPGLSPGKLTDMRSASVNNDCYAQSAVKAGLHKHILHASQDLHKHIMAAVVDFEKLPAGSTFGWNAETSFPKVLGDVIESLAGAIFVDSGYDKEVVFHSMRPLLDPLVTPETLRLNPVKELNDLCHKEHYALREPVVSGHNGLASVTVEVEANGVIYSHTAAAADKKTAKKVASKHVLNSLKKAAMCLQ